MRDLIKQPAAADSPFLERTDAQVRRLDSGATVFVPENYEPNYAYPLLVWTASLFDDVCDFAGRISAISTRNVFGVRIVGEDDPASAVRQVRAEFNIHTERIVSIGVGRKATTALGLFLGNPRGFAGAICVNPMWKTQTRMPIPFRNSNLRGRHVMVAGMANGAGRIARVLNAAGVNIARGSGNESCWRQIDRWVVSTLCDCVIM